MSDSNQQVDFKEVLATPQGLAVVGGALALIGCFLPVVTLETFMGDASINLFQAATFPAVAFVAAAAAAVASYFAAPVAPYRTMLARAVCGIAVVAVLWSMFVGPAAQGAGEMNSATSLFGSPEGGGNPFATAVMPTWGVVVLIAACAAILIADRKKS